MCPHSIAGEHPLAAPCPMRPNHISQHRNPSVSKPKAVVFPIALPFLALRQAAKRHPPEHTKANFTRRHRPVPDNTIPVCVPLSPSSSRPSFCYPPAAPHAGVRARRRWRRATTARTLRTLCARASSPSATRRRALQNRATRCASRPTIRGARGAGGWWCGRASGPRRAGWC
ncbi:unnamed protein product [Chondrus crispus]|uniref:Uncharacterized protein n=1 Tax=Chondrus crispus TaxID=2769 RepID=R7QG15_CHOCR|nr:unnamed protein product [Chondrus crispus]CDF36401.1 unnamed protein product [Chondrus crispus]|eukprot:XP_005716220.1 unnamed protein product [Chondrus crispus]